MTIWGQPRDGNLFRQERSGVVDLKLGGRDKLTLFSKQYFNWPAGCV